MDNNCSVQFKMVLDGSRWFLMVADWVKWINIFEIIQNIKKDFKIGSNIEEWFEMA